MKTSNLFKMLFVAGAAMIFAAAPAEAKKMSDLKVYINPGHGGYTSNDRPITIYPFAQNDTLGYWESKSNLYKGLHMYHILDSLGATPYLSRTKNTEADDRSLSSISDEANRLGADIFLSIHSNAGENVNTPLMLYRENSIGTPRYPENITLSKIMWKNLHSRQLPIWTRQTEYVVGDLTFYQNMWQGGLGVLRTLYVVGLLSEGSMHEHRPEAYRLMNDDYNWLEAWLFVKSIMEFCETEDRFVTGNVAGVVYDDHNLREKDMPVSFHYFGRDQYAPVNGALVELLDKDGKQVQVRTTDNMYNGVFVFRNVTPGEYTLRTSHADYYTESKSVTVTACDVTYQDMPLSMRREFPLSFTYSPNVEPDQAVSCATTIDFEFNTDVDVQSFEEAFSITPAVEGYFKYSDTYRKASFIPSLSLDPNTTYTVKIASTAKTPDPYYENPNLSEPVIFSFTTQGRSRLELIDRFPADNGSIHYVAPGVEFRFDRQINASDIYSQISITDSKGNDVAMNKRTSKFNQLTNGYGNAVLNIQGNLTEGETYTVKLSGELRDRENLPLAKDILFTFTAVDASKTVEGNTVFDTFEDAVAFAYDPEQTVGIGTTKPGSSRSTSTKLFDKAAARFTYLFTDNHDGEIVWNYTNPKQQFNPGDVFGAYIYGDFNNHELWACFTSGASTKYIKICDLDFLGWQYREVTADVLDKEFAPYLFSGFKLVQKTSPITQKGVFAVDNMCIRSSSTDGVNEIIADGNTVRIAGENGTITVRGVAADSTVCVYTTDGRQIVATNGDTTLNVPAGIYIVTVGNQSAKVTVK